MIYMNKNNNRSKPIKARERTQSTVACAATMSEESNLKLKISRVVSRIDMNQTMFMGKFYKHFYDRSDVGLIYFSKGKHPETKKKVLFIGIFLAVVLSIRGSLSLKHSKYMNGYYCSQLYELKNASIKELESIAEYTTKKHGQYSYLSNNYRNLSDSFRRNNIEYKRLAIYKNSSKMIVKEANEQDKRMTCTPQTLNKYIGEYFYDSLTLTKGKIKNEDEDELENKIDEEKEKEKEYTLNKSTKLQSSKYTPINFETVLKEFDNELEIVQNKDQQGTLDTGTDENEYKNGDGNYYVLTDTSQLVQYKIINTNSEKQDQKKKMLC